MILLKGMFEKAYTWFQESPYKVAIISALVFAFASGITVTGFILNDFLLILISIGLNSITFIAVISYY